MSAGGLSYDCLTTSRKVTLPSVDMWGTNMNILRDPPKSVFTRRIDKVGDTQQVLLAQEASGDRIAEMINVYARGVNPMVSVSYDNYGNNAGARTSILQGGRAVKLPYKPEVFHPPVFRQEDLMPLSRQPRTWFYALSNPEIPNIVHQMSCPESKSSVWPSEKVLHADAPARIQYNNETPLDNVQLSEFHKSLRHDSLHPDRLVVSQPQPETKVCVSEDALDPKTIQQRVLMASADSGICIPQSGSFQHFVEKIDPKQIQENKLMYSMFSNKMGNKQLRTMHDMIEKIQSRAIQQQPLPPQSVVANISSSGDHTPLRDDSQVPKASQKETLHSEVLTKPSKSMFWKPAEHMGVEPILQPRAIHEEVRHTDHVANFQIPSLERTVSHEAMERQPSRSLPQVMSQTNHKGLYTKQDVSHTALSHGTVHDDLRTFQVDSSKSVPSQRTAIDDFNNVPISVRDDVLHTSVTSSSSRDQASLQDVLYHDTVFRTNDTNLPSTEAFTQKTYLDKNEWVTDKKELLPRRLANIETNTYRDQHAQGYDVYDVQNRDGSSHVSKAPSAGSFDPRPGHMPMMERHYDHGSELPVNTRYSSLQNRASHQYFERFSDPYH